MNIFRLVGDLSHLLAIIILVAKIWRTRSCAGIKNDTISYLPSKPEEYTYTELSDYCVLLGYNHDITACIIMS